MTTVSVTIRVDEATKQAAASTAEDFGFDLSSVTGAFYRQIAREQRIPLNLAYPKPNRESLEAIREIGEMLASGVTGYDSLDDMFKSMVPFVR